jgi:predicted transcriptional regulator
VPHTSEYGFSLSGHRLCTGTTIITPDDKYLVMNPRDDIAFLVGSDSRVRVLRLLYEQRLRPTEIVDRCTCTRETVQRTLAGFRDLGWVEKTDKHYHTTLAGDMVLESYEDLSSVVTDVHDLRPFLEHASEEFHDVPPGVLSSTTITTATAENPHAPINRYLELMGDGYVDRFRGVAPIVSGIFNQASESAIGPETDMELVIDESVLERSQTDYEDALQAAYDLDQFTLYRSSEPIAFGLALIDQMAWLGAYDDNGNLVACVDGGHPSLLDWARSVYERQREAATELTAPAEQTRVAIASDGGDATSEGDAEPSLKSE